MPSYRRSPVGAAGPFIIALFALGLGFSAGYATGVKQTKKAPGSDANATATPGLPLPPEAGVMRSVVGPIVAIEENTISLRSNLPELAANVYRATVDDATTIGKRAALDAEKFAAAQEKFRAEMESFNKETAEGDATDRLPPRPPEPFENIALKISDLKVGDRVTVVSTTEIGSSMKFVAVSVVVMEALEQPTPSDGEGSPTTEQELTTPPPTPGGEQ